MNYSQQQIQDMIRASALKYGVDPNLALAIAAHESNFNPSAVSPVNRNGTRDWGVMQLNDLTIQQFGVSNPLDPQQNIDTGVRLLAQLSGQYSGDLTKTLWAYNAGSGSVASGTMPVGVQGYIDWVKNYMGATDQPVDSGDGADTQPADTFDIVGVRVPVNAVALGAAALGVALLWWWLSE